MIARYGLGAFEFSQNYCFFWDQLEKANLFLQGVIDTRDKPREDRTVEWLFKNPLSDGGQFTGVSDIVGKYGLVPKEIMPETYSSEHTAQMTNLLKLKLREYGLSLREAARDGVKRAELDRRKTEMLGVIYRMLVLNLGEPPVSFTWTRRDAEGKPVDTREYTPRSFFETYVADDLTGNYVLLMNDPTRDYYKCYEIEYDRHAYDGRNWTYVNLPVEEIKQMAVAFLINIFNPETVIVGGNMAAAGDYIMLPLKSSTNKYSLNLVYKDTKFRLSKLNENANAWGVSMLIRNQVIGL